MDITNSKSPQAKKRDTGRKRLSILSAAIREFRDKGYDGTSMDRIAEIAGVSKRTVYNHFPSKDVLFQAVIDQFGKEMHSLKLITYDPDRNLEDQLSEFADAELAVVNNPTWMGFIKVLLTVFLRDPELARKVMAKHETSENALVSWIKAADKDGKLRAEDPQTAAGVFSSMLGGAFTWPAVYKGYVDPQTTPILKRELIETFLCRYRRQ